MYTNKPFQNCCEPYFESKAKCKAFHMKIIFVCISMKTNFHNKNFTYPRFISNSEMAYYVLFDDDDDDDDDDDNDDDLYPDL